MFRDKFTDKIKEAVISEAKENKYQKYFAKDKKKILSQLEQFNAYLSPVFYRDLGLEYDVMIDSLSDDKMADMGGDLNGWQIAKNNVIKMLSNLEIVKNTGIYTNSEVGRLSLFLNQWIKDIEKSYTNYINKI